ncbi:MAG: oligosaccharide flippase family protein [Thermodesulfobacteriota bacterium]
MNKTVNIQKDKVDGIRLRVFGKNALLYALGNAGARGGAIILIPLYTHSLSMKDYGLLITLLITIQIMTTIMSLGTQKGLLRFMKEGEDRNMVGQLFGSTVVLIIGGGLVVTGLCFGFFLPFLGRLLNTDGIFSFIALSCLAAFFQALFTQLTSYFRAKNEGVRFVSANLAAFLFLVLTNVVFLRILGWGVQGALGAMIITYGGFWAFLFISLIMKIRLGFSMDWGKRILRFSFPLLSAMLWDLVMDTFAIYFLGYLGSLEQVAIYSLGYKIAQIAYIALILPFQLAYEPLVYGHLNSEINVVISKLFTYLMMGYLLVSFGIAFFSRPLLSVIAPPTYFSAYKVVFLMLPGFGFIGVYYIAESLLGIRNRTSILGLVVSLTTLGSLVLNYFLIPVWGIYGAILTFNLTRMLTATILMVVGLRIFPIPLEKLRLGVILALFLFLLFLVYALCGIPSYLYYTVIPITAGTILFLLYSGDFLKSREKEMIRNLLQRIRSRVSMQEISAN